MLDAGFGVDEVVWVLVGKCDVLGHRRKGGGQGGEAESEEGGGQHVERVI